MYILRRLAGGYVFTTGTRADYTDKVTHARRFDGIEEARRHCCTDSEVIVDLETWLTVS
jgi:hypothetical protein